MYSKYNNMGRSGEVKGFFTNYIEPILPFAKVNKTKEAITENTFKFYDSSSMPTLWNA